jgi:hypothetical protein
MGLIIQTLEGKKQIVNLQKKWKIASQQAI